MLHRQRRWAGAAALAALTVLAGCAGQGSYRQGPEQEQLNAAVPPGAPQRCINARRVRQIRPLNESTVLFYMNNGDVWRNRLNTPCMGLGPREEVMYERQNSRICNLDSLWVLYERGIGHYDRGPLCTLGQFDYLTEEQANTLREVSRRAR